MAQLNEADLRLSSGGGTVHLHRARCGNAHINSRVCTTTAGFSGGGTVGGEPGGGSIQASELSASRLRMESGGGNVLLGRLSGLDLYVNSGGGELRLAALYAESALLSSGGGRLTAQHVGMAGGGVRGDGNPGGSAPWSVGIDSGGGDVEIGGLEGCAYVVSRGGKVALALHRCGAVDACVDSGGGDVEVALALTDGNSLALQVEAGGGITLDPALQLRARPGATKLKKVVQAGSGTGSNSCSGGRLVRAGAEAVDQEGSSGSIRGQLVINAGAGRVVLRASSWMDAVRARVAAKKGSTPS